MKFLGFIALAQATFVPPPSPPPPATPGSELFRAEQAQFESQLRQSCISEAGIRIIIEDWTQERTRFINRPVTDYQLHTAIAAAAYENPVDMTRLEQAMRAESNARLREDAARTENGISLLRRLPPKDRAIYAPRYTWMRSIAPRPTCKP